jgi:hypothetical protein
MSNSTPSAVEIATCTQKKKRPLRQRERAAEMFEGAAVDWAYFWLAASSGSSFLVFSFFSLRLSS